MQILAVGEGGLMSSNLLMQFEELSLELLFLEAVPLGS